MQELELLRSTLQEKELRLKGAQSQLQVCSVDLLELQLSQAIKDAGNNLKTSTVVVSIVDSIKAGLDQSLVNSDVPEDLLYIVKKELALALLGDCEKDLDGSVLHYWL